MERNNYGWTSAERLCRRCATDASDPDASPQTHGSENEELDDETTQAWCIVWGPEAPDQDDSEPWQEEDDASEIG